jgi:hypothetical protein
MHTMFLTRADLTELTGYQRPAAMMRWLTQYGYPYAVGSDGWPRVMVDAVRARLIGLQSIQKPEPRLRLA